VSLYLNLLRQGQPLLALVRRLIYTPERRGETVENMLFVKQGPDRMPVEVPGGAEIARWNRAVDYFEKLLCLWAIKAVCPECPRDIKQLICETWVAPRHD